MDDKSKLDLYLIDIKYVRDLANADRKVFSVSPQTGKHNRPFLGIVVLLNDKKYCIPLSSPKEKHKKSSIDLIKITDDSKKDEKGAPSLIGVLNLNNMIPVDDCVLEKMDLHTQKTDSPQVTQKKMLRNKELKWCRKNADVIYNRANKVYTIVTQTPEKSRNLVRRCCDFQKLEKVLDRYLDKHTEKETSRKEQPEQLQKPNFRISRSKMNENAKKVNQKNKSSEKGNRSKNKNNNIDL